MIVTSAPSYVPGAAPKCSAETPISRHRGERMFARCSGECIHRSRAPAGSTLGDDQSRFSPTDQVWKPVCGYQRLIRFQNAVPSCEECSKYPSCPITVVCCFDATVKEVLSVRGTR